MILRDDGNSNIWCQDFLKQNAAQIQLKGATVGMMNPPYSQGTKKDPTQYELSFVEHLLDSLTPGARAAVIVPQSSMTGKTKDEQKLKESIMEIHTLEGVITCNTDTFYGVGTNPVIAVFTAHEPHPVEKICKFIDFRDDGFEVRAHVGLVEGDSAKDKKQHLLDVWFGRTEAPSKFCVESTAQADDKWLHSFYYFNDEIPTEADFEKAIGEYLSFEFSMVILNREYLFTGGELDDIASIDSGKVTQMLNLGDREWKAFIIEDIFYVFPGKRLEKRNMTEGNRPFIGASDRNNGVTAFCGNMNESLDSNVLGINYNGSVCEAFYHLYECIFSDDVKRLHLKNYHDDKYVLLFLGTVIRQQKNKYQYAYKFNEQRMKRQLIMLPVKDKCIPDYGFMEQYVFEMMEIKKKMYMDYYESR